MVLFDGVGEFFGVGGLTFAFGLKVGGEPEHFFEGEVPVARFVSGRGGGGDLWEGGGQFLE